MSHTKYRADAPSSSKHGRSTCKSIHLRSLVASLVYGVAGISIGHASTYEASSLASFDETTGVSPYAALVEYKGNFYGTTADGGQNARGTIFEITPDGVLNTIYSFDSTHGSTPQAALVVSGGKFYGTTSEGGTYGTGTVFEFTPPTKSGASGTVTVLYNFEVNSTGPVGGLVLGTDGYFYGTVASGGEYLKGTLFKISPASPYTLTTLHSFCEGDSATCADGANPMSTLIEYGGKFYGTTYAGGSGAHGTVFAYAPGEQGSIGTFTTLHGFNPNTEGVNPVSALVQYNGSLYGTTPQGGLVGGQNTGAGTIYKITAAGQLTTLYVFSGPSARPIGSLVVNGGYLYGTTCLGGTVGSGSVFRIDTNGDALMTLIDFGDGSDANDTILGSCPDAGLTVYGGTFYGTTSAGGTSYDGTVFKLVAE